MEQEHGTPSRLMPDQCWHCGYNLAELDTGVCPECGAHFVTGRDLARLHDTLVGGEQLRCVTCGTARPTPETQRCPTCGMRYARLGAPREGAVAKVSGVAKAMPREAGERFETERARRGNGWAVLVTLGGLGASVGLVVLANSIAGSYSPVLITAIKIAALLLAGGLLGWLFWRLLRRDVETLRGQLSAGPRGWSHRVVGKCPNCGYDRRGLAQETCPECGLVLPRDEGAGG